ncbi:hypothetical protein CkaCkLH20_07091 [Colletotrichum karsti]|uniref:Copper acquisition factor BIM1-like domain-containing protein n=1 Tax=Colletotrichum karsti TaxID=1095194 RepID=A0A9P6I788_9PEZI|nr:uncharacterized protein CkaCkLH20_07091 [Colletotrichum karsti]KAF9875271.1 hypothetical protein CkaCkLH20_07091 [Colletotrichum karsti]
MAPLRSVVAAALLLVSAAQAHFKLNAPPTIGFSDDDEGKAPCGSFTPDFTKNNVTDFHVDGEAVALLLAHPTANWLFRGTLDKTAGGNWKQLFPIVQQTGLGDFCEPSVTAPASWVGKMGVLSVVADGPDGLLYQCSAVNFVSGAGTKPASCKNATTVTATFTTDSKLTALLANGTGSSTQPSTSASAAAPVNRAAVSLGGLFVVGGAAVVGSALL